MSKKKKRIRFNEAFNPGLIASYSIKHWGQSVNGSVYLCMEDNGVWGVPEFTDGTSAVYSKRIVSLSSMSSSSTALQAFTENYEDRRSVHGDAPYNGEVLSWYELGNTVITPGTVTSKWALGVMAKNKKWEDAGPESDAAFNHPVFIEWYAKIREQVQSVKEQKAAKFERDRRPDFKKELAHHMTALGKKYKFSPESMVELSIETAREVFVQVTMES